MGFNHVTLNPIPMNDPDTQLKLISSTNALTLNSNSAAGTLIPAVAGKRISIHEFTASAALNVAQYLIVELTPAGATVGNPQLQIVLNTQQIEFPFCQFPYFTAAAGNAIGLANNWSTLNAFCFGRGMYIQA